MPYIAIKAYSKDEEIKRRVAERINSVFIEEWGCPPEAISISMEEFTPDEFERKISGDEIEKNKDKMMILNGRKCY